MRRRDTGAGPESHPFNHSKDSDVDEPPPRLRLGGIKLRLLVWKLVITDPRPACGFAIVAR